VAGRVNLARYQHNLRATGVDYPQDPVVTRTVTPCHSDLSVRQAGYLRLLVVVSAAADGMADHPEHGQNDADQQHDLGAQWLGRLPPRLIGRSLNFT
jgi:hypothetical protein